MAAQNGGPAYAPKMSGPGAMPPQSHFIPPKRQENADFAGLQPGQSAVFRGYQPGPVSRGGQELIDNYERCMARPDGSSPFGPAQGKGGGKAGAPFSHPSQMPAATGPYGFPQYPSAGFGIGAGGSLSGAGGAPNVGGPGMPPMGPGGLWTPQGGYQQPRPQYMGGGGGGQPQQWSPAWQKQENPQFAALQPGQALVMQGYGDLEKNTSMKGKVLMDAYERAMSRPTGSFPLAYGRGGAGGKGGGSAPGSNLRISNIPLGWGDVELQRLCEEFGVVTRLTVWTDPNTKQSKGYGFVQYAQAADAEQCMQRLNGMLLPGGASPVLVTVNHGTGKGGGKGKGKGAEGKGGGSLFSRSKDAAKPEAKEGEEKAAEAGEAAQAAPEAAPEAPAGAPATGEDGQ